MVQARKQTATSNTYFGEWAIGGRHQQKDPKDTPESDFTGSRHLSSCLCQRRPLIEDRLLYYREDHLSLIFCAHLSDDRKMDINNTIHHQKD